MSEYKKQLLEKLEAKAKELYSKGFDPAAYRDKLEEEQKGFGEGNWIYWCLCPECGKCGFVIELFKVNRGYCHICKCQWDIGHNLWCDWIESDEEITKIVMFMESVKDYREAVRKLPYPAEHGNSCHNVVDMKHDFSEDDFLKELDKI